MREGYLVVNAAVIKSNNLIKPVINYYKTY